jgi:hypothetical protein
LIDGSWQLAVGSWQWQLAIGSLAGFKVQGSKKLPAGTADFRGLEIGIKKDS